MPASVAVQYARLLKPFPTKRLERALWHVQAEAIDLERTLHQILVDPPVTPEDWRYQMDKIDGLLWSLVERCWEAKPRIELLARDADRAYDVTVRAAESMLAGLAQDVQEPAA